MSKEKHGLWCWIVLIDLLLSWYSALRQSFTHISLSFLLHKMESFTCEIQKYDTNEYTCKAETDSDTKNNLKLPKGRWKGEGAN